MKNEELVLGRSFRGVMDHIQTIPARPGISEVTAICDEVTGRCPVTNQPDYYVLTISYTPQGHLIESKSLKLFLEGYRDRGISCEDLSTEVAQRLADDLGVRVDVRARQKSRGGIVLEAASTGKPDLWDWRSYDGDKDIVKVDEDRD